MRFRPFGWIGSRAGRLGWRCGEVMRRALRIRVAFAPTRLSSDHLKRAYELVAPVSRRAVAPAEVPISLEGRSGPERSSATPGEPS